MKPVRFDVGNLLSRLPRPAARWSRLFGLAVLVGVVAGLATTLVQVGLHHGVEFVSSRFFPDLGGSEVLHFRWGVLLLPAIGGLASGVVVQLLFRLPTGHGTDLLTRAIHREMGDMPLTGPAVKAAAAVGVISCGGSTGPEGPIAALGAALGSMMGKWFGVTARERRILLIAGCAAGVGAIFRCPLGGALFAASVLYREPEFESEAIVPGFVASVIGYTTFMFFAEEFGEPLLGWATDLRFQSPVELIPYAILGPLCGLTAIFFSVCVRTVERRLVPRSKLPIWLAPAFGGLLTGAIACLSPQVMDGRYAFVKNAMEGKWLAEAATASLWWLPMLFALVVLAKCVATGLTVGSGASGGVLGPSVFIGGVVGAFLGAVVEVVAPGLMPETLRGALVPVGMAGVLAATMRTPLAAIVMEAEMTGGYGLIVPLMLVCVSAYVVGRRWGLNHEQVRTAADSPAHAADGLIHVLESWRIDQLMERDWAEVIHPDATLKEIMQKMKPGTRPVFAVVDGGHLVGLVSVTDVREVMHDPELAEAVIAADIMTERLVTLAPDRDVYQALHEFGRTRHDVLPVVTTDASKQWVGMLSRRNVFEALQRRVLETQQQLLREHTSLRAIDHEGQIQQLLMAVTPVQTDRIQRFMVPLDALDKTIREADMRRNFDIQVLGIERADGTVQFPPDLDMTLQSSHRLIGVLLEDSPASSDEPTST